MPNFKKRFDVNPRKRFNNSDNQFHSRIPDESSDMIEAKRVRFKDPTTGLNKPQRSTFNDCSAPSEAIEDPIMPIADSGGPKTSEFAYFKRLKQGVGHTSRIHSVNRKSSEKRDFGPANNGIESGELKFSKDVNAPMFSENSSTLDVGFFLCRQDVAEQSSGVNTKMNEDTEKLKSPSVIRTTTTIDLDEILSTSATAFMNPGIQLKEGDVFSSKRLKLQQLISKTLFPETEKLPKECDVVSLLMNRLLPENSSNIPSESKNYEEQELEDKCHGHCHDSSTELVECWDGPQNYIQSNVDHILGGSFYTSYRESHPSCQIIEDVNTFATTCVDSMLLEFKERDNKGSSLNEIDAEQRSDMFDVRTLLTWNNDRSDYSPPYKTSSSIFKDEVHDVFSKCFDSNQSLKFRGHTHSYEFPTICYDRFDHNRSRSSCLEYKDERPDCKFERLGSSSSGNLRNFADLDKFADNSSRRCLEYKDERPDCIFARYGSSSIGNLRDSADLDEFADDRHRSCLEYKDDRFDCKLDSRAPEHPVSFKIFGSPTFDNFRDISELRENEIRHESGPLLLPWSTEETNTIASTDLIDMDYEDTSQGIYPSLLQDHYTQPHNLLHQKDKVASSCGAPLTLLYGPDQLSLDKAGQFNDEFRSSRFYVISEDHNHFMGTMVGETVAPLISQSFDLDLGLKSESLSERIEQQYDISTKDVCQLLRHGKSLEMPQPEELSLINDDILAQPGVTFPLQVHRIRWLDTAAETNYGDLQIATLDNL